MTDRRALRPAALVQRPGPSAILLLLVYVALSFAMDPGGYLGTDTGAKVATLSHMAENDTLRPDVGYWAEEWDPDGTYHPLVFSVPTTEGSWTNVTTLPMLVAAQPLFDLGGYRLALLLPMAGSILAALACRDLARRLGDDGDGMRVFWFIGLASPMAVYALDLWEHSLGAGLMVLAVALLLRVIDRQRPVLWSVAAGLCLGSAATMRTETFVVAAVAVGGTCLWLSFDRRIVEAVRTGALSVVGFAVPWLANGVLESELGGRSRADRAGSAAGREFWNQAGERLDEAAVTWFGFPGLSYPGGVIAGAAAVTLLLLAVVLHRRGEARAATLSLAGAVAVYVLVLLGSGLAFVPGALIACPIAVGAFWSVRPPPVERLVIAMALAATVLTWMFQYLGGAGPQWGGRYILAPTLLLATIGVLRLRGVPRQVSRTVTTLAVVVTVIGVAWLGERSRDVDRFFDELAAQPEDVVISTNGFLVREAGGDYDDRLYLSMSPESDLAGAVDVVERSGSTSFAILDSAEEPPDVSARVLGSERFELLGVGLWYHRYVLEP